MKKSFQTTFEEAYNNRLQEARRASVDDPSKKSSLRHGTMVGTSKTQSMKNAELNAYSDVAHHGTMIKKGTSSAATLVIKRSLLP